MNHEFAKRMLNFLYSNCSHESNKELLFAVQVREKQQPLHLCISKAYKASLKRYLNSNEHRVMKWMSENNALWLDFTDQAESFQNFNTLEEVCTY